MVFILSMGGPCFLHSVPLVDSTSSCGTICTKAFSTLAFTSISRRAPFPLARQQIFKGTKPADLLNKNKKFVTEIITKEVHGTCSTSINVNTKMISQSGSNDNGDTVAATMPSTKSHNDTIFRILALHGKGESGPRFYNYLTPFLNQLETSINKTHNIATKEKANSNGHGDGSSSFIKVECTCVTATLDGGKWWEQIPYGSRSYEAKEYDGYDTSCQMILQEVRQTKFDLLLGHSQGAILITCMIADGSLKMTHDTDLSSSRNNDDQDVNNNDNVAPCPPLVVLNGVAWPKPFETEMFNLTRKDDTQVSPNQQQQQTEILFLVANDDPINPTEGALRVRDIFDESNYIAKTTTIFHPHSHSIPIQDETVMSNVVELIEANWKNS